jgi:hypothetical protein
VAGRDTLLDTSAAASLLPECARRGVAVLAGGVFNSGVLADPGPGATYDYQPAPPELVDRARRIAAACARRGVPLGAAALRFTLRHPAVTAAVVGARRPEEIREDAGYLVTPPPASSPAHPPEPPPAHPPEPAPVHPPEPPPAHPPGSLPVHPPGSLPETLFDELFEELIQDGLVTDPAGGTR